ncbi:hypothetical protein E3N88_41800 [Mikania micrantha]|uniref:Uncharacterized protein n=1 Tax=Mikania micrantha TaxID=192012 RepID=A0A5N6LJK4_9ASTR|nr:hypothetical protein E3N88_41800 [Mikania micrantha]
MCSASHDDRSFNVEGHEGYSQLKGRVHGNSLAAMLSGSPSGPSDAKSTQPRVTGPKVTSQELVMDIREYHSSMTYPNHYRNDISHERQPHITVV